MRKLLASTLIVVCGPLGASAAYAAHDPHVFRTCKHGTIVVTHGKAHCVK